MKNQNQMQILLSECDLHQKQMILMRLRESGEQFTGLEVIIMHHVLLNYEFLLYHVLPTTVPCVQ